MKRIQKLKIEAFESNFEGLSILFETGQQRNLQISSDVEAKFENTMQVSKMISHIKDRTEHERLVRGVDELIDQYYKRNGIGKFLKIFKKHFPDTCNILLYFRNPRKSRLQKL